LYKELLIQYIKSSYNEVEAAESARAIIRKQRSRRGIPPLVTEIDGRW